LKRKEKNSSTWICIAMVS